MEMRRRQFLVAVPLALGAVSCAASRASQSRGWYRELERVGSGAERILVCMPDTPQTLDVWRGLSDELASDFEVISVVVEYRTDQRLVAEAIRRHAPRALVLMNNPTTAAYRTYLAESTVARRLPAVVVMTSFIDQGSLSRLGATGISYEVPLITAVTNLRRVLAAPVDRVGVVYRRPLSYFVHQQRELARRERVRVVDVEVSPNPNESELKWALREAKQGADALWVLDDDRLLSPHLITRGWIPALNARPWRPAIVGAGSLLTEKQSLGVLAVVPDHAALGVQAASMVYDIAENEWTMPPGMSIQLPLSTTTTVDLRLARERFELRPDALAQIDRAIE